MRASLTPQAAPESRRKRVDFDVLYDFRAGGKDGAMTKQGFLRKQGNRNKGWKRRWFSLENSTISYYKARKDVVPIDVIELIKVAQVTSTPIDKNEKRPKFNIQLHTDKRVYQISAETLEEQRSWLFAIQRNQALSHAGAQDRFVQKAWNSVGLPRGTRGGSQIVELYGKHLTCSTSASGTTSATTEVVTWHIGDIKCTPDAMNDRLVVTTADNLTAHISLSTLDSRSSGADTFLTDLFEAIEHNRKLEQPGLRAVYETFLASQAMEDATPAEPLSADELAGRAQSLAENWPVRYKRGLLSVAVGRDEPMPAWVQVGGLVLSCYEKPDSPKPVCTLDLAQSEVTLESDSIVLNRDGGSKMWVLSGYNISSLKPASDINRLEWAVALCGNMKRLRKQRHLITDEKLIRFKRGCVKHNGTKAWCELDEYALRFFHSAKALSWSTAVLLQTVTDMKATTTELWVKTFGGDEHTLGFEALGAEWKGAIQNNVAILRQVLAGKTPSLPAPIGARGGTRSPNGSPTKYPAGGSGQSGEYATAAAGGLVHVRSAAGAEIQPDEISLGAKLGDGCFGAVFRGVCRANDVAVKIPLVQLQDLDETQLQLLRTEVEIMSANPHPNIVLFMGACTIPGQFKIVTELMHGDLDTLIKRSGLKFSLFEKMRMAKDAALGVNWLHCSNPPIIHRDLKAANLLYNKNETSYKVKVCDFGLSAIKPTSTMKDQGGAKGTPLFMAPEVMMQEEFDEKADVYSFGIVLWEILTGKDPFPHHSDYTEFVRAVVEDEERPPLPADCPTHLRQLIESCWDAYPENRPDFDEINSVLDEIIVEAAISELSACRFWLRYFIKEYVVTWVDFVRALYEYLDETPLPSVYDVDEVRYLKGRGHGGPVGAHTSPDDLAYKCLKALLAVKEPFGEGREVVTIEAFNRFVEWFGPVKDAAPSGSAAATTTTPEPTSQLFTRILTTLAQPWFHGVLSSPEAEQKLTRGGVGSFLVRYSSQPGAFTLSCVSATAGITSYRLLQPMGCGQGFVLDNEHRYPSLVLLVQALEGPLRLEMPCEGSPFARIFKDPTYLPLAPDQAVSDETYCLWDVAKLPAP